MSSRSLRRSGFLLGLCLIAGPVRADIVSTWSALSGLTPDQISPPYTQVLVEAAAPPLLDSGVLTISTSQDADNAFFLQIEPLVYTASEFSIEFECRLISGSSSSNVRGPILLFVTVTDSVGILLIIDIDEVFFVVGPTTPGEIAVVDTNDASHVYRLEHDGSGGFTLFHDDLEILNATAFNDLATHGSQMRIGWGEGSILAHGVSEWTSFGHTAVDAYFRDSLESVE